MRARAVCRSPPPSATAQPASASLNYGGDAAGLICGYLLGADAAPQEIDSAQAAQWLAGQQAGGTAPQGQFLWLHFNLSHAQAVRWMQRHADLPEAFSTPSRTGPSPPASSATTTR